ncbi:uncharacterized protein LOC121368637 [Gigantopelta aegis]|uniref:uncharacterized protein LOC121368637 n=1 Tax=Gigantopelta aegis TaxID=1735272 RepID=UPI001B8898AE|nr:uncharacterized protein LOC121368637 [Gigantopelta aegis]
MSGILIHLTLQVRTGLQATRERCITHPRNLKCPEKNEVLSSASSIGGQPLPRRSFTGQYIVPVPPRGLPQRGDPLLDNTSFLYHPKRTATPEEILYWAIHRSCTTQRGLPLPRRSFTGQYIVPVPPKEDCHNEEILYWTIHPSCTTQRGLPLPRRSFTGQYIVPVPPKEDCHNEEILYWTIHPSCTTQRGLPQRGDPLLDNTSFLYHPKRTATPEEILYWAIHRSCTTQRGLPLPRRSFTGQYIVPVPPKEDCSFGNYKARFVKQQGQNDLKRHTYKSSSLAECGPDIDKPEMWMIVPVQAGQGPQLRFRTTSLGHVEESRPISQSNRKRTPCYNWG